MKSGIVFQVGELGCPGCLKVSILDSGEIFDSAGTVDLITSVTGAWDSCRALLDFFLSFECLYRHYVEIEMIVIFRRRDSSTRNAQEQRFVCLPSLH